MNTDKNGCMHKTGAYGRFLLRRDMQIMTIF